MSMLAVKAACEKCSRISCCQEATDQWEEQRQPYSCMCQGGPTAVNCTCDGRATETAVEHGACPTVVAESMQYSN